MHELLAPNSSCDCGYIGAMLNSGPWNRLALTVRWLRPEFSVQFPTNMRPPSHMPLVFGPLAQQSAAPHRHESRAQKHTSKSQKKSRRHRAPSTDEEVDVESNAGSDVDLNTDVQSATHLRLTRCAVCKQTLHVRANPNTVHVHCTVHCTCTALSSLS